MSFSGITKLLKWSESLGGVFSSKKRVKRDAFKPRQLHIDPLEERQLLTVNTVMPFEQTANVMNGKPITSNMLETVGYNNYQTINYEETTWSNQAVAGNNNGDFIMAWVQNDGTDIINPKTGQYYDDYNIYARYVTDELQQVTIPPALLTNNIVKNPTTGTGYGRIKLMYAPNEIQHLTIKTATGNNFTSTAMTVNVAGTFEIGGFDVNSDGVADWTTVKFNETDGPVASAAIIQQALRGLGGKLADITVTADGTKDFTITFGESCKGENMPELQIRNVNFTSGFYAGAIVTTVSEPMLVTQYDKYGNDIGILIDPSNPAGNAQRIQAAFDRLTTLTYYPRVNYLSKPGGTVDPGGMASSMMYGPTVNVTVVDKATIIDGKAYYNNFNITFVDGSGKIDQPELYFLSAVDEFGAEYFGKSGDDPMSVSGVRTVKQNSDVFRVNAPEPDDPLTMRPEQTNQVNVAVAMDTDGDFVITWQGEVYDATNQLTTNIYARRFSPQGIIDNSKISFYDDAYTTQNATNHPVQGVRPEGDQFQVNTYTNGLQSQPSVGMDPDGNFIISWSDMRQTQSYFEGISAKWYDREGKPLTGDVVVSDQSLMYPKTQSQVAISSTGFAVISWTYGDVLNMDDYVYFEGSIYQSVYFPFISGVPQTVVSNRLVAAGYNSSVSFDSNNRYLITYTKGHPDTSEHLGTYGVEGSDAVAQMFAINDAGTNPYISTVRTEFRTSSQSVNLRPTQNIPNNQWNTVGGLDSDGDLIVAYQGYGPDESTRASALSNWYDSVTMNTGMLTQLINKDKNSDLTSFFNPSLATTWLSGNGSVMGDIDSVLRYYLINAQAAGASYEQLCRLSTILQMCLSTQRGGANDILTSAFSVGNNGLNDCISSDANVTSTRDGENTRFYLYVPQFTTSVVSGGNFNVILTRDTHRVISGDPIVSIPFGVTGNVFDAGKTQSNIYKALNSLSDNGTYAPNAWTEMLHPLFSTVNDSLLVPAAAVQLLTNADILAREGTAWALPSYITNAIHGGSYTGSWDSLNGYWVYEIVLMGGAHDDPLLFGFAQGSAVNRTGAKEGEPKLPDGWSGSDWFSFAGGFIEQYGNQGTEQKAPGISVMPNGSYVVSWLSNVASTTGMVYDNTLNYRYFKESTDTAGPKVTDVILPNGMRMANSALVTNSLKNIVVTFDEEMCTAKSSSDANWKYSVYNLNNWVLMKDGKAVTNAISGIKFGMNASRDEIQDGSSLDGSPLALGTNKWEAIVTFSAALGSGQYELVLKNTTRGLDGNAIFRDGLNPNGHDFSRKFIISAIDGLLSFDDTGSSSYANYHDTQVNENQIIGEQQTRTDGAASLIDTPRSPTSVASDSQGNFVTVWTSQNGGIWAKIYNQTFVETVTGRTSVINVRAEFQVTTNPKATYASVAMDPDGDFVVTWVQESAETGKDIYAKAFNANGLPRTDSTGAEIQAFRVNSWTKGVQNYPDIAVDSTGGFVITWESLNQNSKDSGYDIYFQRYDSACNALGGVDEIQALQFYGRPSEGGTFILDYEGKPTAAIPIGANAYRTAENIQKALRDIGLRVDTAVSTSDTILIQFTKSWGSQNVAQLTVKKTSFINPKSGQSISASTITDGASGETKANDYVIGDKRYPSIAVSQDNQFIISWTSWGQGNDSPYESNIYAKNFTSNQNVVSQRNTMSLQSLANSYSAIKELEDGGLITKYIVSADSPVNHLTGSSQYTGVVIVEVFDDQGKPLWYGSGSLLSSGMHILTAAHVASDDIGVPVNPGNMLVLFETADGSLIAYPVSANYVHQSYFGNYTYATDLAVLELPFQAPEFATRYDIYRGGDEIGSVVTKVGYGATGTGSTGYTDSDMLKRSGQNTYEAYGNIFGLNYSKNTLVYDFDDGMAQHDALGVYFGKNNLGLGAANEVCTAPGDSGGPGFIAGRIAGVTSYGGPMYFPSKTDVSIGVNSSFGEFAVDVRVSAFADWIDSIVETGTSEYLVNQTQAGNQIWSDVAISMTGEVIFSWTSYNQDMVGDGPGGMVDGEAGVYARRFTLSGTPVANYGDEFLVNNFVAGDQYFSSVSIADNGDFMVAWESWQDTYQIPVEKYGVPMTETVTDFGIYAKRFTNLRTLVASRANGSQSQYGLPDNTRYVPGYGYIGIHGEIGREFLVNKDNYIGDQTGASVALNSNGDAIVVFQGPSPSGLTGSEVFYRVFPLSQDTAAPHVTDTVVVITEPKRDSNDAVIMDADGNIAWQDHSVLQVIRDGSILYGHVTQMYVTFSEEMYHELIHDQKSITNLLNWQLQKDGVTISGIIVNVDFGYNLSYTEGDVANPTNKWEALITFDSDPAKEENQWLTSGLYTLVIKDTATDVAGNRLDGDYNGAAGANFSRIFTVISPSTTAVTDDDDKKDESEGPKLPDDPAFSLTEYGNDKPAIASAADGTYIVVAVHYGLPGTSSEPYTTDYAVDPITGLPRIGNIVMQRYDKNGTAVGTIRIVNNFLQGIQTSPDIAMDSFGNSAIVWSGAGATTNQGIFCRIYDASGSAVCDQFMVNTDSLKNCFDPKVAYDNQGNIVVSWREFDSKVNADVIRARVFTSDGTPVKVAFDGAAAAQQLTLISATSNAVVSHDIAFSPTGELVVTWAYYNAATKSQDIFAKVCQYTRGTSAGSGTMTTKVASYVVNTYLNTNVRQFEPKVEVSGVGTYIIVWTSDGQDGSGYGIYARRFDMSGKALPILGSTADARINTHTVYAQYLPQVSMAPNGNFVVTWSSYDQEPGNFDTDTRQILHDYGVFARAFNSAGNDLTDVYLPYTSTKEFRLNFTTKGNQQYSVAAMNNDGISFAWTGDTDQYFLVYDDTGAPIGYLLYVIPDVYHRTYRIKIGGESTIGGPQTMSLYSTGQKSGGGGYTGQDTKTYQTSSIETMLINGTAGNDLFEVTISAAGAIQVKLNGKAVTIASTVKNIQIEGNGGTDKITITSATGDNTASMNASDQRVSLTGKNNAYTVSVSHIQDAVLSVAGTNNAISVFSSLANETLNLKVSDVSLAGTGHSYAAKGFNNVTTKVGSDTSKVLINDSSGDDVLTMMPGLVTMTGTGYRFDVCDSVNVSAYSSRGNDKAYLTGNSGSDSLSVTPGSARMTSGKYTNRVLGFMNVIVEGNGGNDTATFVGSAFNDRFTGTANYSEMLYSAGNKVGVYGFNNITVDGGGGYDSVVLRNVTLNSAYQGGGNSLQYTSLSPKMTFTIKNVNEINGPAAPQTGLMAAMSQSIDVIGNAALLVADDDVTVSVTKVASPAAAISEDDLYDLLASDSSTSSTPKKAAGLEDGELDTTDLDYLFSIGALS